MNTGTFDQHSVAVHAPLHSGVTAHDSVGAFLMTPPPLLTHQLSVLSPAQPALGADCEVGRT